MAVMETRGSAYIYSQVPQSVSVPDFKHDRNVLTRYGIVPSSKQILSLCRPRPYYLFPHFNTPEAIDRHSNQKLQGKCLDLDLGSLRSGVARGPGGMIVAVRNDDYLYETAAAQRNETPRK